MRIKIVLMLCCFLFLSGPVHADTIYLQSNPAGNAGQVLEEYPDAIVIKFPKSEIQRIEAEEKPNVTQASAQKVIWIDDGDTITLRLPKQSVQVSGSDGLPAGGRQISGFTQKQPVPTPLQSLQELSRLSGDRGIQGKVLMRGGPLAKCAIRILKVTDSVKDRMLSMFSGEKEKEEQQSFEAVTDEHGLYTFTNVPYGEYILYWKPEGSDHWIRRLSENPDITLVPGRPASVRDIETNVKTVN